MKEGYSIRFRRGNSAMWNEKNPVLAPGEPGHDYEAGIYRIGDGYTKWFDLPAYMDRNAVMEAINSQGGNDGESLVLLYQNKKV